MNDSSVPFFDDLLTFVANLVPDLPKPSEIFAEIQDKDRLLWLEGWCDGCIAGSGFPPKDKGMLREKLDYLSEVAHGFREERTKGRGMSVQWSGFPPLSGKKFLSECLGESSVRE